MHVIQGILIIQHRHQEVKLLLSLQQLLLSYKGSALPVLLLSSWQSIFDHFEVELHSVLTPKHVYFFSDFVDSFCLDIEGVLLEIFNDLPAPIYNRFHIF